MSQASRDSIRFWLAIVLIGLAVLVSCQLRAFGEPHPAIVQVTNTIGSSSNNVSDIGSGTMIGYRGFAWCVTCSHLFSDGVGRVTVRWPDCTILPGRVIKLEKQWDLAAIVVDRPKVQYVELAESIPMPGDQFYTHGWKGSTVYSGSGVMLRFCRTVKNRSNGMLEITGTVYDGMSGGAILDTQGRYVATIWGTDGKVVIGSHAGRVKLFLDAMIDKYGGPRVDACEEGLCEVPPPQRPAWIHNPLPLVPIEKPSDKTAGVIPDSPPVPAQEEETLVKPRSLVEYEVPLKLDGGGLLEVAAEKLLSPTLTTLLIALGVASPLSAAGGAIAIKLGAAYVRRRRKRKEGKAAAAGSFPGSVEAAAAEDFLSRYAAGWRDDEGAKQFLQLAFANGHNPVHDAIIGRFAFDFIDEETERNPNGPEAIYGKQLKQRLEGVFNQMAPLSVGQYTTQEG